MMSVYKNRQTTVIICAAGMGTRLGIGSTKALVDIDGLPLIIRQLEMLKEFNDVRIVVGFQAEKIIKKVNEYRKDIMFVFNYQYRTTGVADSLRKGLLYANENIISIDGDILANPEDFNNFLAFDDECLGISQINSAEPIKALVKEHKVFSLSKYEGNMQWPGIAKIKKSRVQGSSSSHVYDVLNEALPLPACYMRTREIDTQEDYDQALEWFKKGQID